MAAELVGGAVLGAVTSELLKSAISEAKKVWAFKALSKELASLMEQLLPIVIRIESLQDAEDSEEFKSLRVTIDEARVLVDECSGVKTWDVFSKSKYTRKVERINKKILKFCQVQLQLILLKNQKQHSTLLQDITRSLQAISKRLDLMNVPAPVYTNLCSVRELDQLPVGLDWPLTKLKSKLLDDSVGTLLVTAPPGCGKTTLATHLCHDPVVKVKFKHIFFNVVSSTPNFRVIVQNLFLHNGYGPVAFDSNSQAALGLEDLLKELVVDGHHVLLVLDDVWLGAEFSLLKYFQQIKLAGYKILVTSRSLLPSFDFTYRLKPLKDEDAKSLLIQWSSAPYHTSPDEYEDLFRKILKRCNGFPIVIEVVGISLKEQPLYVWKSQVESWSQGETILGNSHPTVLECLQPSFNALKPHLKECFLDMGSFLEDQKIRASVIIDIWSELYLYGKGSSRSSHVYMKYLNDLASQNLLRLIPLGRNEHEDGFYNELLVTQHDVLRDLAIHQSELKENLERKRLNLEIREDEFPDWCSNPRHPSINASLLSITTDDLFSSNWVEMDCPNVEALVLNLSSSYYALPSFIARMTKLKVVTITNHGSYAARLSKFSCFRFVPNLKRIRLEKVSVTLLNVLQLQLVSLKKLSLVMCSFGEVYYDTEEIDVSKALPSLQELDIDYCYDLDELPFWVCEVVSLEKLSITNCNKLSVLPEAIGDLSKLKVLRLSSCINLSELPDTTEGLRNLQLLDISDCIGLRKLPLEIGNLQKLEKIWMRKCWRCELPDSVRNLKNLVVRCDEETRLVLWERLKLEMSNLIIHEEEAKHSLNLEL